ncbi:cytochrome P450 [Nocardioides sp. cx-173]|uniref:cytochrome P450 n=1 Tax=Nocardioides sp. cx-173 TaxID=2898796 RepID=UPI001E3AFB35|nr:cytochrome P450 [Nocardioides sp. cx-173]MCD4526005.1 cytochrome P450 [Nocardioides sp. cx-173]UGB43700.1 cytochrome P450 [Nocardioides sp. cx-173]
MSRLGFDPFDYGFQEDPYPVYARCRAEDPLHHNEEHDFWVLTRHADVQQALRTEGVYSNAMGVSLEPSAWGPHAHKVMSFLGMDPPRQQRLRSLVSKGFTPRRVMGLEPRIQQLTDHYLDRCLERAQDGQGFDWITDFAGRLPMDVISEMMGVPQADRDEVRRLADLVVHREDGVHDVPQAGMEASLELVGYYADMLAQRKRQPTEDLTSALLAVRQEDGQSDGDRLSDDEIIAFLFLMVVAGNETTTKLLGHALFHLARHPDQLDRVFADPDSELVGAWIEETLRFDTSSQLLARHLLQDVALHDKVAPEGAKLVLAIGSANRDERVFRRPDDYDLDRPQEELARLVSFGGGRHFCLGANLARLEAQVALRSLVRRVRRVEVAHDDCVRVHSVSVRGFASVPVRMEVR